MKPLYKYAGIAGIITGLALLVEFALFMASGVTPDKLANPAEAIALIQQKEVLLRVATFFGFAGSITSLIYIAGLAAKLREQTPTRAAAVLYFGILGGLGHMLVALSFYLGFPALTNLAADNLSAAVNSWGAFLALTNGFQGVGNILLGLTFLAAGSAILARGAFAKRLGWIGLIAGITAVSGVITTATMLSGVSFAVYIPSIILAVAFNIWAGARMAAFEQ
jgi:hypothetical protein